MKKISAPIALMFFMVFLLPWALKAQENKLPVSDEVSMDVLRAPVSPAASLLGISPGQVEQPSDPAAFMASVYAASGGLTGFPSSYAVDLAPAWLFAGNKITLEDFLSRSAKKSIAQSLVVSMATHTAAAPADSLSDVTRFSAGVKVSLIRGWIDPATARQIERVRQSLSNLAKSFDAAYDSLRATDLRSRHLDSLIRAIAFNPNLSFEEKELMSAPIREQKTLREDTLRQYVRENLATGDFDRARQALEEVRVRRIGPKLDLAAAFAWDFPGMSFDDSQFSAWAAWMTFGYEFDYGLSLLGIFRYNYFSGVPPFGSDQLVQYKDEHGLDAGVRIIYSHPSSRFGAGFEGIRRSMTGSSETGSSWRFTANAEYEVGRNKKLSLVFGRDFEGNYTGEGDLIVALNLLLGFGTGKKL